MNKFCTKCGATLEAEDLFCGSCGQPIQGNKQPIPPRDISEEKNDLGVDFESRYEEVAPQKVKADKLTYDEGEKKYASSKKKTKRKKGCLGKVLGFILLFFLIFGIIGVLLDNSPDPGDTASNIIADMDDTDANDDHMNHNNGEGSSNTSGDLEDNSQPGDIEDNSDADDLSDGDLADYTFMVFMNGSDLESTYYSEDDTYNAAATLDLIEMTSVGSTDDVNIIVETGGTAAWANEVIDPNQNQRYKILNDDIEHLADLGLKNIGDPQTLYDFIVWTVEHYPANHYVLDFWNHGGGPVYGFGVDEHFYDDYGDYREYEHLTLEEIEAALDQAQQTTGVTFEVIGFDACLMGSVEVAHTLSPYAHYLVASEETEPSHGWDYEGIFSGLTQAPEMKGGQLGRIIADTYQQHAYDNNRQEMITLSVIDLDKIDEVVAALSAMATDLTYNLDEATVMQAISRSRSVAEAYGDNSPKSGYSEIIDLYDFASTLGTDLADDLTKAIEDAVIYRVYGESRLYSGGLSIFFPYMDRDYLTENFAAYESVDFIEAYEQFLATFIGEMLFDTEEVRLVSSQPTQEADDSYSITIREEDRQDVMTIYNFVGLVMDDVGDYVISLGFDSDVYYDETTGIVKDNFNGYWTGLNNNLVSLYIMEEQDDYNLYTIPAYLNGELVDIIAAWYWDESLAAGGYYEVLGAMPFSDDAFSDKAFYDLQIGDTIQLVYTLLDFTTGLEETFEGDPFVLEEEPYLDFIELYTGESYMYGFYMVDYAQNGSYSDFVIFNLTE